MAVKVISKAPVVTKKVTCHNCGYKLSYTNKDVKEYHGRDISGWPDGREWIVCANCKKDIILNSW